MLTQLSSLLSLLSPYFPPLTSLSAPSQSIVVFVFVMDVVIVAAHGRGSGYGRSGGRARD